jgi:EVE domain
MTDSMFYFVSITRTPDAALKDATLPIERKAGEVVLSENMRTALNGKSPSAWLFQSSPILYDLRAALRSLKEQVWSVSRYARNIRSGDRVYLWEAGPDGGIIGLAEIIEPARLQPEPPEQLRFARIPEAFATDRVRSRLRMLRVIEPVITRQTVVSCPELSRLSVLRCSRGTNFRLSLGEWKALDGFNRQHWCDVTTFGFSKRTRGEIHRSRSRRSRQLPSLGYRKGS